MRLIVADKIKEFARSLDSLSEHQIIAILNIIADEMPTVDAEPVRHGRWIEVDVGDCCYRCSECGFIRDAYLLDIGNYCPKCGAKMDWKAEK